MIIWSGVGFIVPVIAFACFLVTQLAMTSIFQDDRYYTEHGWPKLLAFWIAALLVGIIGWWLESKETKIYIDKATGEEIVVTRPNHSFFLHPGSLLGSDSCDAGDCLPFRIIPCELSNRFVGGQRESRSNLVLAFTVLRIAASPRNSFVKMR